MITFSSIPATVEGAVIRHLTLLKSVPPAHSRTFGATLPVYFGRSISVGFIHRIVVLSVAQLVRGQRLRDASTVGFQSIIREDRIPHSALEVSLPNLALCAIRGVSYAGSLEDAFTVSARALPTAQGVERLTLRIPELFLEFVWLRQARQGGVLVQSALQGIGFERGRPYSEAEVLTILGRLAQSRNAKRYLQ